MKGGADGSQPADKAPAGNARLAGHNPRLAPLSTAAQVPSSPHQRPLPDLERLSSYTDGAFFDCESPRPSSTMLVHTPSVTEVDYHEAGSHRQGNEQHALTPRQNGGKPNAGPRESSRPTHVMVDDIGRLRVDSASSETNSVEVGQEVEYAELAQPRPEIILRWKRFAILVVLSAILVAGVSAFLSFGLTVQRNVPSGDAEARTEVINTYSGIVMGFVESIVGLGFEELFPVFIVYLHNLKWYPGDAPGVKETSKFKKVALMLFIPAFMIAVGSSLSAVQANQKDQTSSDDRMRARHLQASGDVSAWQDQSPLEDTILRSAVSQHPVQRPRFPAECRVVDDDSDFSLSATAFAKAIPAVRYGFPARDWHSEVSFSVELADAGTSEDARVMMPVDVRGEMAQSDIEKVMKLSTLHELVLQGHEVVNHHGASDWRRTHGSPDSPVVSVGNVSDLIQEVMSTLSQRAFGVVLDEDKSNITLERLAVSPLISLETVTISIPVVAGESDDLGPVCGPESCIYLDSVKKRSRLPHKGISMAKYAGHCLASHQEDCSSSDNAAFLYGFTSDANVSTTQHGVVKLSQSLLFAFGKLTWRYDNFAQVCGLSTASSDECNVLHYPLAHSGRHIVASKRAVLKNMHGASSAIPILLIRLVEPPLVTHSHVGRSRQTLNIAGIAPQSQDKRHKSVGDLHCGGTVVDAFARYIHDSHLYLNAASMSRSMAAAGLFHLLQHGSITDAAETAQMALSRRLATANTVEVYLKNTTAGIAMAWVSCGVLLALSLLVIVLPNARARLEPLKGGNARAERFIAVQTEQIYPNLVYKKRFLIGKTGEEIKFREFAVESVGLHHKMDEDEQIFL